MNSKIVCSLHDYSRDEAVEKLKSLNWFNSTSLEVKEKIISVPDSFSGFLNDLCDRPEKFNDFEVLEAEDIFINDHFAHIVFNVKSDFTGVTSQKVYTAWKKGVYHSMRGILLLETEGKITHFVVRNCCRFAVGREITESMGSVYPPITIRDDKFGAISYIEKQLAEQMRIPNLSFAKYYDLGLIYPDPAMSDNVVTLFAATQKITSIEEINLFIKGKKYDDKGYSYSFEIKPISELLSFLTETNDSFLLAIFGRLQALNVIKL